MTDDKKAMRDALYARCSVFHGHGKVTPAEVFRQIADWSAENDIEFDTYGEGPLIESFEEKIATLLGFPAARFMPTGKVAQNVALRLWCDRAGRPHFGMHPTSHLEHDEARAYSQLFGLQATLIGPAGSPLLAEHLVEVDEPMAALLIELPIREAGGQLPTWDQLEELKSVAADRSIRLHMDGARFWETAAFYDRPYADICRGFDSVYVSFYKGIGGMAGSMLLGPEDFIAEAKVWQLRAGGEIFTLAPYVAAAAMRFDAQIDRMPAYYAQALALAEAVNEVPGVVTLPRVPHTNMMHVFLPLSAEAAEAGRDALAEEVGVWLCGGIVDADMPGHCRYEWYVGEATMKGEPAKIASLLARLIELAETL